METQRLTKENKIIIHIITSLDNVTNELKYICKIKIYRNFIIVPGYV
jgi:hypothetical protein